MKPTSGNENGLLYLKKIPIMKYVVLAFVCSLFLSCSDDKEVDYITKNDEQIQAYIKTNSLDANKSETGLYYVINEEGTGTRPTTSSTVTVAYKGTFIDGKIFDKSDAEGISFGLTQVIKGWTEGITYFKEGGNGILLVPAHLGYGNNDHNGIPGGSVLIFDVNLIEVK